MRDALAAVEFAGADPELILSISARVVSQMCDVHLACARGWGKTEFELEMRSFQVRLCCGVSTNGQLKMRTKETQGIEGEGR